MSIYVLAGNAVNHATDTTGIGSTNENSLFPNENVGNSQPWVPFMFSSAGATRNIEMDWGGTNTTATFCSFHGHNLDSGITNVRLYGGNVSPATNLVATFDVSNKNLPSYFVTFNSTTYDYWGITFSGTTTDPIQIGAIALGEHTTLGANMQWGWKTNHVYPSAIATSPNMQYYTAYRADKLYRTIDLDFVATSEADMLEIKNLFEDSKYGEEPLVIVPNSDGNLVIHGRILGPWEYSHEPGGLYKFKLSVIEDPIWMEIV